MKSEHFAESEIFSYFIFIIFIAFSFFDSVMNFGFLIFKIGGKTDFM